MKTHTEIMAALVEAGERATNGRWTHRAGAFLSAQPHWVTDERQTELLVSAYERQADIEFATQSANARATVALAAKGMELLKAHYEAVKAEWVKDVTTTRDAIYAEHAWPKDGLVETGLADIHALLAEWEKKDG